MGRRAEQIIRSFLRKKDRAEALEWLATGPHGVIRCIGEQSPEESAKMVRDLLGLGVPTLWVLDIRASPNGLVESASMLLAVLPTDPNARSRVIEWKRRWIEEMGFEAEPDDHQPYLLIWAD